MPHPAASPPDQGLTSAEAEARLRQYGPNQVEAGGHRTLIHAFADRFRNPLVLMLAAAAAISAFTGDASSAIIIAVIVLMSMVLDVVQESRAGNAAEKLRARVSLSASVLRDGRQIEIPASRLVPGDMVRLMAGDLVPADGILSAARDLYVNEAALTGESFPAEKHAAEHATGASPQNLVFMGSSVVSGTASALLTATGRRTQLGAIAGSLRKPAPPTAFLLGVRDFGRMIVRITLLMVLFTLLVNLMLHRPPLQSFLFAIALAVGLTPELLPMIVSVTLAHGALRLSRKEVIVKQLSAMHDLGSMDILCSDKTGTLTEARIALVKQLNAMGGDSCDVLGLAQLNARFETGLKSALDQAILAAPGSPEKPDDLKHGELKLGDLANWRKLDEVPFDFERRRVSVLVEGQGQRLVIVKGAPEDVLLLSSHYLSASGASQPFDDITRARAREVLKGLGADGLRSLAVAWRVAEPSCMDARIGGQSDMTFAGFLGFLDPPKQGAREALAELASLGVAVKILTGDGEDVTHHVCGKLGLDIQATLTGAQIAAMSDEALAARLAATSIFSRVTPPQKLRILSALRRQGHVVGYLGDGINDAPALHEADIGFSVDTGVDVAKEAASMILLRKDLGVLAEGVREGRRTYANILKYVMMGTSSNFGNMFSMAIGSLILPFLPMLPLQILLNNLLYDFSEIAIPMDRVDPAMLTKPHRWNMGAIRKFMMTIGPISSLFDFLTFYVLLDLFGANEATFHTGWFVESLATQVLVIFIIRTASPLRDFPHPALVATSLGAVAVAVILPFTGLGLWFGLLPLKLSLLGALALITAVYLVLVFFVRRWLAGRQDLAA